MFDVCQKMSMRFATVLPRDAIGLGIPPGRIAQDKNRSPAQGATEHPWKALPMKRLIVCCDGTWNNPGQEENGIPAPTNVFKIHNAIVDSDGGIDQLRYYHPGVGGEEIGKMAEILGGLLGAGIDRHICSAYQWLATEYAPGDEIYLYGFSRGAFTVRSLCAFLGKGLLDLREVPSAEGWSRVHAAYEKGYRIDGSTKSDWARDWKFHHDGQAAPVHFLGVWDTVGALGVPDDFEILNLFDRPSRWRFHDMELGAHVRTGRHAMAMDDMRSSFTVARWSNRHEHPGAKEIWFPGVHSDVGGGYADNSLSDGALRWMIEESKAAGLVFHPVADSIVGNPVGPMHNSYKGVFAKLRSRPRNIPAVVEANRHRIHDSAFERQKVSPLAYPAYHPTHLLASGGSATAEIYADTRWNPTGIYLEAGGRYLFEARGEWQAGSEACDWTGIHDRKWSLARLSRGISAAKGAVETAIKRLAHNVKADYSSTKRIAEVPWMGLVGAIANDGVATEEPVSGDGSPSPHQHVRVADFTAKPLEVTKSGYLYAFANDVWTHYNKNHGSIRLVVKRV